MKKRMISITECGNPLGSHTIIIGNIRYQNSYPDNMKKFIELFLSTDELFFGFYRIDGLNLTLKQQEKLKNEIPTLFKKYGDIQILNEYLSIARINFNEYNFIPSVFDYYLETIMFNPAIKWEIFKQYYSNYQNHTLDDIIVNHFANVLFCYFDSGDLAICFNSKLYNPDIVRNVIDDLFF